MERPEQIIRDLSPPFQAAARRGDATEALRTGRGIMQACHTLILDRGHDAARWSWARRLGFSQRPANMQEVLHYEEIARTVSLILQQMGVVELHEDQRVPTEEIATARTEELREVQRELGGIEILMGKILEILGRGEWLTERVVQRIDETVRRTDVAHDHLFRYYADRAAARPFCSAPLICAGIFSLLLISSVIFKG